MRMTTPPQPATPEDNHDEEPSAPVWLTRKEMHKRLTAEGHRITMYALEKMTERNQVVSRRVPGPYGEQVEVTLDSVMAFIGGQEEPAPSAIDAEIHAFPTAQWEGPGHPTETEVVHEGVPVPMMQLPATVVDTLMAQIGVLHESGERTGKAEAGKEFAERELVQARERITELESLLAEAIYTAGTRATAAAGEENPALALEETTAPPAELLLMGGPGAAVSGLGLWRRWRASRRRIQPVEPLDSPPTES